MAAAAAEAARARWGDDSDDSDDSNDGPPPAPPTPPVPLAPPAPPTPPAFPAPLMPPAPDIPPYLNCRGDVLSTSAPSVPLEALPQPLAAPVLGPLEALPGRWRLAQARAARAAAVERGAAGAEAGVGTDRPGASSRRRRSLSAPRVRQRLGQPSSQSDAASVAAPAARREVAWTLDEVAPCRAAVLRGSRATKSHLNARRTDSYDALPPESPAALIQLDHSVRQLCGGTDQGNSCRPSTAPLAPVDNPPPSRTNSRKRPPSPPSMPPSCVSNGGGSGGGSRLSTAPLAPVAQQPLVRRARSPWPLPPMLQPLPPPRGMSRGGGGGEAGVGADRPGASPRRRRSLSAPRARQSGGIGGHSCSRPRTPHGEEAPTAQYRLPPPPPACASSGGADGSRDDEAGGDKEPPPDPGAAVSELRQSMAFLPSSPMRGTSPPQATSRARRHQQSGQDDFEAGAEQLPGLEVHGARRRAATSTALDVASSCDRQNEEHGLETEAVHLPGVVH